MDCRKMVASTESRSAQASKSTHDWAEEQDQQARVRLLRDCNPPKTRKRLPCLSFMLSLSASVVAVVAVPTSIIRALETICSSN